MPEKKLADTPKTTGLAGVVAGDSAICTCGIEGKGLSYRGYAIEDLCEHASFEEAAWLLTRGERPSAAELAEYRARLRSLRRPPEEVLTVLERLPAEASPMDVLRTAVSVLGSFEPERGGHGQLEIADELIARLPGMLLYWYRFHRHAVRIGFDEPIGDHAGYLCHLLHGTAPEEAVRRAIDVSLILYAEHDFNASTFTARIVTSTLSDFYSAVTAAIGALRGALHGGANEQAMKLIERFSSAEEAEAALLEMLERKEKIMGFGHRIYTVSDPRSKIVKAWAARLSQGRRGDAGLFSVAERIEEVMWREKKIFPNLDFFSAVAYRFCDIPTELFTPLFVLSRIAGWSAHIMEQRSSNRLIRPLSRYVGPELKQYSRPAT